MDELTAFEHQVAVGLQQLAGPGRRIDPVAMCHLAAAAPHRGVTSMFTAAKLVAGGAILALFAGLLLEGMPPGSPDGRPVPGAAATAEPSRSTGEPAADDVAATTGPSSLPLYEAVARLVVDPGPDPSVQDLEVAAAKAASYASQAASRDLLQATIDELGFPKDPARLSQRIRADAVEETFGVNITVQDEDAEVAQALATALGDELQRRVREVLITPQVKKADAAIAAAQQQQRILQARFDQLRRKSRLNQLERNEMILLAGQLSAARQDIQDLRQSSSAGVRYLLEWSERPGAGPPSDSAGPPAAFPSIDIVVADRWIARGTAIEADMLAVMTVSADPTNAMAFTDVLSAVGKVAAIDIIANQPIAPNMLTSE